MVTADHNSCIIIKILPLNPSHKLIDLSVRTGNDIRILVIPIFVATLLAYISILKMCIDCEQCQVKRFVILAELRQLLFCKLKEIEVLKSPPYPT